MLKYLMYAILTVVFVTAILQMVNPREQEPAEVWEELKITQPYKTGIA